jgi:hypothetical protein
MHSATRLVTGNCKPVAPGPRQPVTGNRQLVTGNCKPVAPGNRQPATGNRQLVTGNFLPIQLNQTPAFPIGFLITFAICDTYVCCW